MKVKEAMDQAKDIYQNSTRIDHKSFMILSLRQITENQGNQYRKIAINSNMFSPKRGACGVFLSMILYRIQCASVANWLYIGFHTKAHILSDVRADLVVLYHKLLKITYTS